MMHRSSYDFSAPNDASLQEKLTEKVHGLSKDALQAEACKRSYFSFLQEFWETIVNDPPQWNWHIPYLCAELSYMVRRVSLYKPKLYDLVVNIPPGTTKSLACTVFLPAWAWTQWPWMKFIKTSHSSPLSLEHAELTREIIKSDKYNRYFPGIRLKQDASGKSRFKIVYQEPAQKNIWKFGGGLMSTSINSSVTGFHAHIKLTDDPIDPTKSLSEPELKSCNTWISQNLSSRNVDKKVTPHIMIMQRVTKNDPSGVMLEAKLDGKKVKHICLPGEINTPGNEERVRPKALLPYYKAQGGLLDPQRLDDAALLELSINLGKYGKMAQVDQNPQNRSGGMFKVEDFQIIKGFDRKEIIASIRYWDKAGTAGAGCYTAGVLMHHLVDGTFVVEDVVEGQWAAPQREKKIKQNAQVDGINIHVWVEQEPGSGGLESAENTIRNLAGFCIYADKVTGAKEVRAEPYAIQVENGNVKVLNKSWTRTFINRHVDFPDASNKDVVDSASGAMNKLLGDERPGIRVIG